ncbi:hypothetical protein HYV86_00055 [Candidatus Woesearchaeota archaeon]|nr:hypothetical protein [Candidatus Woesearchaeota archaeon]
MTQTMRKGQDSSNSLVGDRLRASHSSMVSGKDNNIGEMDSDIMDQTDQPYSKDHEVVLEDEGISLDASGQNQNASNKMKENRYGNAVASNESNKKIGSEPNLNSSGNAPSERNSTRTAPIASKQSDGPKNDNQAGSQKQNQQSQQQSQKRKDK